MNYSAVGALTTEQQAQVDLALSKLPPCYSEEFHQCYSESDFTISPNCELFDKVYDLTGEGGALDKAVQDMPYCPVPEPAQASMLGSPLPLAIALAAGVGLGYVIWGYER